MSRLRLALKVDVDTERGTRRGVPALVALFRRARVPATFYLSLGPDRTGRALRRVVRPGFLAKLVRTRVPSVYGLRTLGNGLLWPGPQVARRHAALLRELRAAGFDTGIHAWDHVRWQDGVHGWDLAGTRAELARARAAYRDLFGGEATSAAAPGWQASVHSLEAYDEAGFRFASDARGREPFFPRRHGRVFRTLQIPTTLPTLDELLGRRDVVEARLVDHLLTRLRPWRLEVMTLHAEIEGGPYLGWLAGFLVACRQAGVEIVSLAAEAEALRAEPDAVPVADLVDGRVDGRSGTLAMQGGT